MSIVSNVDQFTADLIRDGFEVQTRTIPADTFNDSHAHPFEVRALVIEGGLNLACNGVGRDYGAGDIFTMVAGMPHVERFGAASTTYVVGRKQLAT